MTVLIDTRTIGTCLNAAQRRNKISHQDVADILHTDKATWRAYCRGSKIVPNDTMIYILSAGLTFINFQYQNRLKKHHRT